MFREVLMKLTEACPCNCLFCDAHEKYRNIKQCEISDDEWMDFCGDLIRNHIEVAIISGGEALLRESLVYKMIHVLKKNGVFVVLNTSGVLFNSTEKLDRLLENYPSLLVFSIDNSDADKHDQNRKYPGLFNRVCDSISYIKSKGIYPIAIRTVITKNNYLELPEILRRFNTLGVDCIKLTHIEDDYEGMFLLSECELKKFETRIKPSMLSELSRCNFGDVSLFEENYRKIQNIFSKSIVSYFDYAHSKFAPQMTGSTRCSLIERFITVQSNGNYLPCCEAEHHGWPVLGNLKTTKIDEVLSSEIYNKTLCNRQEYCTRCTEFCNLQIDFDAAGRKVVER